MAVRAHERNAQLEIRNGNAAADQAVELGTAAPGERTGCRRRTALASVEALIGIAAHERSVPDVHSAQSIALGVLSVAAIVNAAKSERERPHVEIASVIGEHGLVAER